MGVSTNNNNNKVTHSEIGKMDEHQAAVITAAIEQQKRDDSRKTGADGQEVPDLKKEKRLEKAAPRSIGREHERPQEHESLGHRALNTHKGFAVDPALNVGIGIVRDIIAPKVTHSEKESAVLDSLGVGSAECTRCKKEYAITDGKVFKLCPHCRELQRERSRRWQQKTKLKENACRRCGVSIPPDQGKFVLCPPCRLNLRTKKAKRFESGKCVHCSGVNDSTDFKVCSRCRSIDKDRRKQLEDQGKCNRCSGKLQADDNGRKVCSDCRARKKTVKTAAVAAAVAATSEDQHNYGSQDDITTDQQVALAQQLEANMFAQDH